jgi:hypothetical protein
MKLRNLSVKQKNKIFGYEGFVLSLPAGKWKEFPSVLKFLEGATTRDVIDALKGNLKLPVVLDAPQKEQKTLKETADAIDEFYKNALR